MAVAARTLLVFDNGKKFLVSTDAELIFKALAVSSDGNDNGCTITENAGHFDFNAKNLSNVGNVDGVDVSAFKALFDGHVDGGASKHDATEIDYERADGSKKDIQAASDDVETALTDLDDNKISKAGTIAFTGDQSMGGNKLTNLGTPTQAGDAVPKSYADAIAEGIDPKASVRYSSASNIASILSANAATVQAALDEVGASAPTLASGDRVLIRHQTDPIENGIYSWDGDSLVRATDFDGTPSNEVSGGARTFVENGDLYGGVAYVVIADGNVVVGTDPINWSVYGGSTVEAGAGLVANGNAFDVNVDDSTLEIAGDVVRVKDAGITLGKMAADSVDENKILSTSFGSELVGGSGAKINVETTETCLNNTGSSIPAGRLVYVKDNAGVKEIELADADTADSELKMLGVTAETIADQASGGVHVRPGTKVTPNGGGSFVIGRPVYASETAGSATQTAPVGTGKHVYRLGRAISTTVVRLDQEHEGEYL